MSDWYSCCLKCGNIWALGAGVGRVADTLDYTSQVLVRISCIRCVAVWCDCRLHKTVAQFNELYERWVSNCMSLPQLGYFCCILEIDLPCKVLNDVFMRVIWMNDRYYKLHWKSIVGDAALPMERFLSCLPYRFSVCCDKLIYPPRWIDGCWFRWPVTGNRRTTPVIVNVLPVSFW